MKRLAILLLMITTFAACGRPYRPGTNATPIQDKEKVLLLDHGMTYYLKVVRQAASRLPGGQLMVKLEIENEENKDVWTDVQVIFRGPDGFEIEKTDWEPFMFHRRGLTSFQRNSLNTQAADYRVMIRNAQSK